MAVGAGKGGVLGKALVALSLGVSVVVTWRDSLWTGILALPATFVLLVLVVFAISAGRHAHRWQRNPVTRTCAACGAPVRYRVGTTCGGCGADHPLPRL